MKLLIIEDDNDINKMLKELLILHHYEVASAYSGTEGLLYLAKGDIDLVLLDLMIPGKDGKEVIREIKKTSSIPVIILTAISDKEEKMYLFSLGADDYVTKPFDNDELLARIQVQLRHRSHSEKRPQLCCREITLDLERYECFVGEEKINLSRTEFKLLQVLMENPNRVFTKNTLYEMVWEDTFLGDDNTLYVHISNIRNKLKKVNQIDYIETVWGIGFKMKES